MKACFHTFPLVRYLDAYVRTEICSCSPKRCTRTHVCSQVICDALKIPTTLSELVSYSWVLFSIGHGKSSTDSLMSYRPTTPFPTLRLMRCFVLYGRFGASAPELLERAVECIEDCVKVSTHTTNGDCCISNSSVMMAHAVFFLAMAAIRKSPEALKRVFESTSDGYVKRLLERWANPYQVAAGALHSLKRLPLQRQFLLHYIRHTSLTRLFKHYAFCTEVAMWTSFMDPSLKFKIDVQHNIQVGGRVVVCIRDGCTFDGKHFTSPLSAAKYIVNHHLDAHEAILSIY